MTVFQRLRRASLALALSAAAIRGPSMPALASDVAPPIATPSDVGDARAPRPSEVAKPSGIALSGALSAQILSTYLYRGFLTEENSLIVQTWLDLHAKVPLGGAVDAIDVHGQFWNSLTNGATGTGGPTESPRAWSEADWTIGATATFGCAPGLSLDLSYAQLRSPNASFLDLDEASMTIAYDDSAAYADGPALFRGWRPSINLVVETRGQEDLSGESGTYLGVGIAPTFAAWPGEGAPTIAIPILTGWSLGHYYEDAAGRDHVFGFLDVGVDLTAPLEDSGWTLKFSAHALFLGKTPAEYAADRDFFLVLTAGLSFAF